jgi:hypothetical protein
MKTVLERLLYWSPRVLSILLALFLSIFALDVFIAGRPWIEILAAFLVHLWPSALILVIALLAWRWEWIGAAGFFLMALLYFLNTVGKFDWTVHAAITGPLALIGLLFLLGWLRKRKSAV